MDAGGQNEPNGQKEPNRQNEQCGRINQAGRQIGRQAERERERERENTHVCACAKDQPGRQAGRRERASLVPHPRIRVTHPSHASESSIRVTHPSHASESRTPEPKGGGCNATCHTNRSNGNVWPIYFRLTKVAGRKLYKQY